MAAFSREEFGIMLDELLVREPASFDMLCRIAEKTLRPSVYRWCGADPSLKGRGFEEDILQEIYIRLIKTCVTGFFLRSGVHGEVNDDPEGFRRWMFRVAENIKRDFSEKVRRIRLRSESFSDGDGRLASDSGPSGESAGERTERLRAAFEVVLSADAQPYKVLTWIAQCLFMAELDVTKIRSNELILENFEQKTLFEMRDMLLRAAESVPWLGLTAAERARLDRALDEPYGDGRVYGSVRYGEFFMKKGGKATISDWMNRMNSLIRRVIGNETSDR